MRRLMLVGLLLLTGCASAGRVARQRTTVTCGYSAGTTYGEVYRGPYCDANVQLWP